MSASLPTTWPQDALRATGAAVGVDPAVAPRADADRAWQRALAQAQHDGFSSWFGPPPDAPLHLQPRDAALGAVMPSNLPAPSAVLAARVSTATNAPATAGSPAPSNAQARVNASGADAAGTTAHAVLSTLQGWLAAPGDARQASMNADLGVVHAALAGSAPAPFESALDMADLGDVAPLPPTVASGADLPAALPLADAIVSAADDEESAAEVPAKSGLADETAATSRADDAQVLGDDAPRVHAEWGVDGVSIWLGLGADAAASIPQLAGQIEHLLQQHGQRLRRLVCNGRLVAGTQSARPARDPSTAWSSHPYSEFFKEKP